MQTTSRLHPNIHKLVISEALSKLGDNFTEVALALFVLSVTRNNVAALGVVLAMVYVPRVALGWAVVGFIDRLPKRAVLLGSNLGRALLVASIPFVSRYSWAVAAVFLMYTFSMVYQPVLRAIQPQIAGTAEMNAKGNARQETYMALADIGGYVAAGGVLFIWGIKPAFLVDAATFIGAGFLVGGIRAGHDVWGQVASNERGFWQQLSEGVGYLKTEITVRHLVFLSGLVALGVGTLNTLLAPLSHGLWHVSSKHYVWLLLALALGSLVSGILIERRELLQKYSVSVLLGIGFFLTALGFGLLVFVHSWEVGAVCLALVGFGNSFYGSALMMWVQQAVPLEFRGRALAVRGSLMGVGGALGAMFGGVVAQDVGLPATIGLTSAVWLLATLWSLTARSLKTPRSSEQTA